VFPALSMAGLATGCRPSAIVIPTATDAGALTAPPVITVSSPLTTPSGTRTTNRLGELRRRVPGWSPNNTRGRLRPFSVKPRPRMAISPPEIAARGASSSMSGLPFSGPALSIDDFFQSTARLALPRLS